MIAFISSAYRGPNVFVEQDNARIAQALCLLAMAQCHTPFASHLLYTQFLDDHNPKHRENGIQCCREMLLRSSVMYVYAPHTGTSKGVQGDLQAAQGENVEVITVTADDLRPYLEQIRPSRLYARIFGEQ